MRHLQLACVLALAALASAQLQASRPSDVTEYGAKALGSAAGYALFKEPGKVSASGKGAASWGANVDLTGVTDVYAILTVDQSLIGTVSTLAKTKSNINFIISDPVMHTAGDVKDKTDAEAKWRKAVETAYEGSELDVTAVPDNVVFEAPRKLKTSGPNKLLQDKATLTEIEAVEKEYVENKKKKAAGFMMLQTGETLQAKLQQKARGRARAQAWYYSRTTVQNWQIYECNHYPYQNIHYSRHPNDYRRDHTSIDGTHFHYFGFQAGGGSRYSPDCDNNCTNLERARLYNAFWSFRWWRENGWV